MQNLVRKLAILSLALPIAVAVHAQTPIATLEAQASQAYQAKHYAESARLYAQAVDLAPPSDRSDDEYNETCSLALSGDKDRALAVLTQAVEDGYGDRAHTASDTDLTSLHDDPRFTALLAHMDALKKAQDQRWGTAAFKTAYAPTLSDADKVAGLSLLWAQARFGFANFWHVPQLDWDATYKAYVPQVLAAKTTNDYYNVLERFYALLKDGHTGVYSPADMTAIPVPFETCLIDDHVIVVGPYDTKYDMQGVKPGDEILSINGLPVKQWAAENVAPYATASSPQDLDQRLYFRGLMRGQPGTIFHLVLQTPAGKQSQHDFAVGYHDPMPDFAFRLLPGNVAYVALNEFGDNTDATEWDKHWPEISKAKSIILDMRRNGGGDDSVGAHVLMTLLNQPVALPKQESPEWIATYRAWGQAQPMQRYPAATLPPDPDRHFAGKVVMLTGPNTFSAAEDLVVVFATSKRGVLVGEATGGSTGQPLLFDLPGGGIARVCTKHDTFPDGHEFVGVGVPPDIAAHITRDDLIHGTDSVLDAGLKAALQP
jgi:C-terminal processing protease CtpA/Prc